MSAGRVAEKIKELGDFSATDVVADIGGGTGKVARVWGGKGAKSMVIEPSVEAVGDCQKYSGLDCLAGTAEQIPLEDSSADKVILASAFHHVQNQEQGVKEIFRILKPGGISVIRDYHPEKWRTKWMLWLGALSQTECRLLPPYMVQKLLEKQGFSVQAVLSEMNWYYIVAGKT